MTEGGHKLTGDLSSTWVPRTLNEPSPAYEVALLRVTHFYVVSSIIIPYAIMYRSHDWVLRWFQVSYVFLLQPHFKG